MADPLIDVTALARRYDGRAVVADVTLVAAPGEIVGLVGANGGGKTTSLRMIAGLLRPDAGHGRVLGEDVRQPPAGRRRRIGYMSQRLALYGELTVAENLKFHADAHGLADPRARIAEIAGRYAIESVLAQLYARLSGGWARRVQFVATLLHAPPLLLLDEPTAGLDAATRQAIWRWLEQLAAEGCAIVVSTHDLVEAERCSSVLLYHEGRARAQATPAALAKSVGALSLDAAVLAMAERAA